MNLEKIRRVLPDFQMTQFHMLDTITSLRWETFFDQARWTERKRLLLTMTGASGCEARISFDGVDSFRFQGNGQISGFYIRDMAGRGYESGVRYEAGDYEEDALSFYCGDVTIEDFRQISPRPEDAGFQWEIRRK